MARGTTSPDLGFHGDQELDPGLTDLAVNVRLPTPPPWLTEVVRASLDQLGHYPDSRPAAVAIAAHHGVDETMVLSTSGGAEAFTLVARAGLGRSPLVVHPQFTEPEAALLAAGQAPERLVLTPDAGFALDPTSVPDRADLVVLGNPTNPTGVLHPAAELRRLLRPGRTLLVDEAFMDATPRDPAFHGEPASLIAPCMPGLLVARSLTKTWGLAGLRAGYVVGDPDLIARLRAQQPPWSVSTPALAATVAVCSERGTMESASAAEAYAAWRAHLLAGLQTLGVSVAGGDPCTPFVLIRAWDGAREALRAEGFAVRRGDTFPGLGPDWIRVAVREPDVSDRFLAALAHVVGGATPASCPL